MKRLRLLVCSLGMCLLIFGAHVTASAQLAFNNVLGVAAFAPIEFAIQFNAMNILVLETRVGVIEDTGLGLSATLGGLTVGADAKWYVNSVAFSGVSFNNFVAGGALFTPGDSNGKTVIITVPYLVAGTDTVFRKLSFLSLILEGRWFFTAQTFGFLVGAGIRI